jgi:hypothetical protein
MISDGRPCNVHCIVKIVHDLTRADQRGGLYSALELVAGIEVENIALIFFLDGFDHLRHELKSSIVVTLIGIGSKQRSGESSAVDVVCADDGNGVKVGLI